MSASYATCGILTNSAERQPIMESNDKRPNSTSDRNGPMYGRSFILQKDVKKRELELTCCAEFYQFCAIGHLLKVFISTLVGEAASIK